MRRGDPWLPQTEKNRKTLDRALQGRVEIIRALGGACCQCGTKDMAVLEIDHPNGRAWSPRKKSPQCRLAIYRREFAAGLLSVLCRGCNGRDGARRRKSA